MAERANEIAELFHTPFLTLAWRAFLLSSVGISVYAFNAYKHAAISGDETIQKLQADAAAVKALAEGHDVFIRQQVVANQKLDEYFEESRRERAELNDTLVKLGAHFEDQDKRLDRIENKLDRR